jgi:chitodextrinase
VTGYRIERCQGAGCTNFSQVAAPAGTGTTYTDTGLSPSTTYRYQVRAVDAAGNLGAYSNAASAMTGPDTTAPSAPGTLAATATSSTQISLSWGAATDNVGVTGYQVLRCQGALCTDFTQVAQTTGTGTSYNDGGLSPSTSYGYEVRAIDAAGNVGPVSNATAATTQAGPDTTAPSAPGTLAATGTSSSQVSLSWGAATDNVGVTGYRIERCQGAGCTNFSQVAAPAGTGTTYTDTGLSPSTTYSYQVRAVDAAGNLGAYSNAASATTQAVSTVGLVAAYGFNEGAGSTVADSSGKGNTGTILRATWATAGKYGRALSFNGTNARVNVPNSSSLQLTSGMTLEAWVYPTLVSSTWRDVIYKGDDNYYLEATADRSGSPPAGGGIFGGANSSAFGSSGLPVNTWSYLAATYDGATVRLYVNGTLVATQAITGSITVSTNQLQIGGDSIYGQYFRGMIDEIRIYNASRSAAEIQTDMTTPVTGP